MTGFGRIGFWAGSAACSATVAYLVVQIAQVVGVLHFPVDEILIFGTSLAIVVPFVFVMLALHYTS
jgi:DMSO/TMAO reductase YedYZ heme-binding membrane subunit